MDEIKRLQQLAEIKVNNPTQFRQVPFKDLLQEIQKIELERMENTNEDNPNYYTDEEFDHVRQSFSEISDYDDLINYLMEDGNNSDEANEYIFDILVKK